MYYEINVSLDGKHLFATSERSIVNTWKLQKVYNLFKEKFPEEDGYKINVTKWDKVGKLVEME